MKPWQKMLLFTLTMAIVTYAVGSLIPNDRFILTVGMSSCIVLVGMRVMRPAQGE